MGNRAKAKEILDSGLQHAAPDPVLALWYQVVVGNLSDKTRSDLLQFST